MTGMGASLAQLAGSAGCWWYHAWLLFLEEWSGVFSNCHRLKFTVRILPLMRYNFLDKICVCVRLGKVKFLTMIKCIG